MSFALQSPSRSYQPNPTPTRVCAFEIYFHSPISQAPMLLLQLEIFRIFLGIVQFQHLPVLTNDGVCTHPLSIQPTCPVRHKLRANLLPASHSFGRQVAFSLRYFFFMYSLCTHAKVGATVIAKTKRENRTLRHKGDRFVSIFKFVFSLLTTSTSPCARFAASVNLPLFPVRQFLMTIVYRCESIIEEGLCRRLHTRGPGQIELILCSVIFVSILENHQHLNGFTGVSIGKQNKKATR